MKMDLKIITGSGQHCVQDSHQDGLWKYRRKNSLCERAEGKNKCKSSKTSVFFLVSE